MSNPSAENLKKISGLMARHVAQADRVASPAVLVAVSKTHPPEAILPLLDAGHRQFGENRVQEAQDKWPALKAAYPGVELHLIGSLQSNKAEDAVALFDVIHVLDRLSLATALAKAMARQNRRLPCFVQVNIGAEPQKGGCPIVALPDFLAQLHALDLPVIGLMCIPPADKNPAPYFALLHKLAQRHGLSQLSMGMSADFETALQLGATHIRVGSALFGAR